MTQTYQYRVRDRGGNLVTGTLVADNQQLVLGRLREMGYTPLSVTAHKVRLKRELHLGSGVKLRQLAVFSRQFATMINAGLPIMKALTILSQQTESTVLAKLVGQVRADVEKGSSLSAALAKHPRVFNDLYVSMVRSGETGGVLESVLIRLADNLEREVTLRGRVKSAMTYPIVVLGFVTLIMMAMLLFIVPQFKSIYTQLKGTLPLPTRILLGVSNLVKHDFPFLIVGIVVFVILFRRYIKTESGRFQWDTVKLKIPIFGNLFRKTALARFSRVLSILHRSGVPILQSLEVVSQTVRNAVMEKGIADVQESVKQGESLARPLARHAVFPPMVVQMLAVGEETGSLDTMLEKVAVFYDNEVTATVDSLTSIIEPLMIFVIGGAVGLSVIALYLPMFNIINLVK
jgi:type IV pilus assembly protein PilC